METPGDPENGDENQNETTNTPSIICETPIKSEQLASELEQREDQCSTGTDVPVTILKANNIDEKEENRLEGGTPHNNNNNNQNQHQNDTPNTPTVICEPSIKLVLPYFL